MPEPSKRGVKVTKKVLWRAIRDNCLDCCCDDFAEVRFCSVPTCKLRPYRFGRTPKPTDYAYQPGDSAFDTADMEKIHEARLAGLPDPILASKHVSRDESSEKVGQGVSPVPQGAKSGQIVSKEYKRPSWHRRVYGGGSELSDTNRKGLLDG